MGKKPDKSDADAPKPAPKSDAPKPAPKPAPKKDGGGDGIPGDGKRGSNPWN